MAFDDHTDDDVRAIRALIARQFESLNWAPGAPADLAMFAADFLPGAALFPAARPVKSQTVEAFIERMKGLSETNLQSFSEAILGSDIRVFGNVAVAVAACEVTENNSTVTRSVEMMLLVKNDGEWRIASQAWDAESPSKPIPSDLLALRPE